MDIRKIFNIGRPNEFTALDGVSMSIESGKVTVIKGPSGSGKTTLLSVIGCMARPTAGRIFVSDKEITSLPERFLTDIRRRIFGFVFQQFHFIKGISALENVMLPAYPAGEKHSSLKKRALEILSLFNLFIKSHQGLSGFPEEGRESHRTGTHNNPSVVIVDEPTATRDETEELRYCGAAERRRKTVLVASHDPIVFESDIVDHA
jgi:putative ABC transport system ATP-binding protein